MYAPWDRDIQQSHSRSHLTKEGFPDYPITGIRVFPIWFAERDVNSRFLAARKLPDSPIVLWSKPHQVLRYLKRKFFNADEFIAGIG